MDLEEALLEELLEGLVARWVPRELCLEFDDCEVTVRELELEPRFLR